jgi:hypothetical protein
MFWALSVYLFHIVYNSLKAGKVISAKNDTFTFGSFPKTFPNMLFCPAHYGLWTPGYFLIIQKNHISHIWH